MFKSFPDFNVTSRNFDIKRAGSNKNESQNSENAIFENIERILENNEVQSSQNSRKRNINHTSIDFSDEKMDQNQLI